ncbi:FAD-binding oxidoreductase [Geodermatophilus sp. YIM 151500]|uniref:FAD-binding oxidoreductase n=1 Tax=Geodermatophilus sp. YIM 151500 TaxID=2984531 RepID=UPI0021E50D99|nr:FAD-binding oxidoreductase [Geodermatophilus sp. YIM 151500]MCV2490934.1 FAD-binding oxidoreductase [Geodermatophilus sp. YIM 151500]
MAAPTLHRDIEGFRGEVLRPGDAGYDDARRIFNGMVDRSPAVIARCTGTDDVVAAVRHAVAAGMPLAVHGGGHGVVGHAVCEGGLMLDLRPMNRVEVRVSDRTVSCGGGTNWGQFDAATQEHGLAVTGGRVPSTGVAGLTLGSGSGWLERKLGFTCDSLLAAEVVTAAGEVVTAGTDGDEELLWGLRGGGGNFGVVTRLDFRAHPVEPLLHAGLLLYPHEAAAEVIGHFRDFMAGAPDEVGGAATLITAPAAPFVPEAARGRPAVGMVVLYVGDPDEGARVLRPLVEFGPPAVAMVQPMPYSALQRLLEAGNPPGLRNWWTADFLTGLPDELVDVLAEHTARVPSPTTQVAIIAGGGAPARVPDEATALGTRTAPWNVHFLSIWADADDDERNIAWTRALSAAAKPWATGGAYLNFIGDEGHDRVRAAFGPEKYARLVALKDRYDPDNVFCLNQNVPPSRSVATGR